MSQPNNARESTDSVFQSSGENTQKPAQNCSNALCLWGVRLPSRWVIVASLTLLSTSLYFTIWFMRRFPPTDQEGHSTYSAQDIGQIGLGGHEFTFAGFNDYGEAAGGVFFDRSYHTGVTSGGTIQDLGALSGYNASRAYAMNNQGDVVGSSYKYVSAYWLRPTRACLWSKNGKILDLGVLAGFQNSRARAINDKGQAVGHCYTPGTEREDASSHAFLWETGKMRDLGVPAHCLESSALGINTQGQVVGIIVTSKKELHGFLWENGRMQDLGMLAGDSMSRATAVNDRGQVVGVSGDAEGKREPHVVLWERRGHEGNIVVGETYQIKDLGQIPSARGVDPVAINSQSQIVLNASAGWGRQYTYLYEEGKGFQRIRTLIGTHSGFDLYKVLGLNNKGRILVGGRFRGGPMRTYILTALDRTGARRSD